MTAFYLAGVCLVIAQALGIYALLTRKADFAFALIMVVLVVVAVGAGLYGVHTQIGGP